MKTQSTSQHWVLMCVMLMIGIALIPIVVDQVETVDTASWNFTGAVGAKTLFMLLPFVYIAGIVAYFIASLLGKV